jgi:ureidoglycolate hydrolase
MSMDSDLPSNVTIHDMPTVAATRENFAIYGTLIEPAEDGAPFGPGDAMLDLSKGTPRFYIMALTFRGMVVKQITRHRRVTQCLATAGDAPWMIALAPPRDIENPEAEPEIAEIKGFTIKPGTAIKLHAGTWHAGPFFETETMNFFNLELADTNETDHQNCYLARERGVALRFRPE